MPKRTDIKKILMLGAGPIVIGQACEFDYSGAQACKALREEGFTVILVNSNPATIMTDPSIADATYIEPVRWETVEKIIKKENPDALLPTMGGQTALNCALDLDKYGILKKYCVTMIGANAKSIYQAENRSYFKKAMNSIGLECPRSGIARSIKESRHVLKKIGFPCVIRPFFTMGGSGGGIAYNLEEFNDLCIRGLDLSPTHELLIDESLIGWKEYEMEVMRDIKDNCIIVCSIENVDPMGIHTGDSITVAPAQTLTDKEYQRMRNASIAVLRKIGVETGGSNVQFGICPNTGRMVVIEMNPRVSRSSALASKATGFPIAKIAAKLSVGFTLDELRNNITQPETPASFEPSLDYVVTKIPRFAFEKFPESDNRLTTQMKSVGEVMAIGRTFQESIQKALRGLEVDATGFNPIINLKDPNLDIILKRELSIPSSNRIFYVADAFRSGKSVEYVYNLTYIDKWFLVQIEDLVNEERKISNLNILSIDYKVMYNIKRKGFSDSYLATLLNLHESKIRHYRHSLKVFPVYKRIDTCAAEFSTNTAYMYSTYEEECESNPSCNKKIIILGGGPNRIGQGIEFDYCCVHAVLAMRKAGYETIIINCNPETVSTDYDISDRLYFEPVTLEDILEIVRVEAPTGVIVQYGGQTPIKLCNELSKLGVPILGTSPDSIDRAENRERFKNMITKLDLLQPLNATVSNAKEAIDASTIIGYPIIVRPSYVLGGRSMQILYEENELIKYMQEAVGLSSESPILLDHFVNSAIEIDVDAISDGQDVVIGAIMQHIEQAGVHSGDSSCSIPVYSLEKSLQDKIRIQVKKMAIELGVIGLMNVQIAVKHEDIYVLEINPRASRTIPFVSKCIGKSLADIAAQVMIGKKLKEIGFIKEIIPDFFSVKTAVFPFTQLLDVDPILGPEMKSTGEVMGIGDSFAESFLKSQLGSSSELVPKKGCAFISVRDNDKKFVGPIANELIKLGFNILATSGTANIIKKDGLCVSEINKVNESQPNIVDMIKNGKISLIINTTEGRQSIADSYYIRRNAIKYKIYCTTTITGAQAICEALKFGPEKKVRCLQDLHAGISI